MSLMTPALAGRPFDGDPGYAEGRADAYDAAELLTVDQLTARAAEYAEYADLPRAFGYMDAVLEHRLGHDAVTAAETELAWAAVVTR
jgi:hypothetical protein